MCTYPVRCAHIPPQCHFSGLLCVCVDSLHWLPVITVTKLPRGYFATKTCPLLLCALPFRMWMELQFLIIFEVWALVFEAQAVILKARGPMWTFSGMVVWFYQKSAFADPPPRCPWTHFLRSREAFFFRVFLFSFFCEFRCPEIPLWEWFGLLFGSRWPLKKQVKVCKGCQI